jgi:hypothetical protein
MQDLQPYVCLEKGCKFSDTPLRNKMMWVKHLDLDHDFSKIWKDIICPLCSKPPGNTRHTAISHLADHLEENALTILPANIGSEEETSEKAESNRTNSLSSGKASQDLPMPPIEATSHSVEENHHLVDIFEPRQDDLVKTHMEALTKKIRDTLKEVQGSASEAVTETSGRSSEAQQEMPTSHPQNSEAHLPPSITPSFYKDRSPRFTVFPSPRYPPEVTSLLREIEAERGHPPRDKDASVPSGSSNNETGSLLKAGAAREAERQKDTPSPPPETRHTTATQIHELPAGEEEIILPRILGMDQRATRRDAHESLADKLKTNEASAKIYRDTVYECHFAPCPYQTRWKSYLDTHMKEAHGSGN